MLTFSLTFSSFPSTAAADALPAVSATAQLAMAEAIAARILFLNSSFLSYCHSK
jgi:hypothetical protein